jgi:VanZ family protein
MNVNTILLLPINVSADELKMHLRWLDISIARRLFYAALISITFLALIPATEVPASTGWDKADHWLGFFALAFLGAHAYPQHSFWRRIAIALLMYGIGIEFAQWCTPDRQADWRDVVADAIGIAAYGLVVFCCQRIERMRVESE